jgi:hypothetical protein
MNLHDESANFADKKHGDHHKKKDKHSDNSNMGQPMGMQGMQPMGMQPMGMPMGTQAMGM